MHTTRHDPRRVYESVIDGHGVRKIDDRYTVYFQHHHRLGFITTITRESVAWTLCDRLRDAFRRGTNSP